MRYWSQPRWRTRIYNSNECKGKRIYATRNLGGAGRANQANGRVVSPHRLKERPVDRGREIAQARHTEHAIQDLNGQIGRKTGYGGDTNPAHDKNRGMRLVTRDKVHTEGIVRLGARCVFLPALTAERSRKARKTPLVEGIYTWREVVVGSGFGVRCWPRCAWLTRFVSGAGIRDTQWSNP